MTSVDATNVLRGGGRIDDAEPHPKTGVWTYRVHTRRMCVVVAFRSTTELVVVTAWREKR